MKARYSHAVKARDFFGETSRRTFVTRGLISSRVLFSEGQICRLECKIRSARIFGEPSAPGGGTRKNFDGSVPLGL